MSFGGQSIIFPTVTGTGVFDESGMEIVTSTDVTVTGCRHRPLKADETPEFLTDVATQIWKSTCPPESAAMSAKASGVLKESGVTYRIIGGPQMFRDMSGAPFKVTILSKIESA